MIDPQAIRLSESLVDELVGAIGLPKKRIWHNLVWQVARKVTERLASLATTFEQMIELDGLPIASEWALSNFCNPVPARGAERIPQNGPLLVVSNHPGAYDALVIFSKLIRKDIRWIGSEIPFLAKLPNVSSHIIFASRTDPFNGMSVLRSAIRHLRSGGTLLYFGAGHRDPDPSVYPDAGKAMDDWLKGTEVFFKHVPELRVIPTVVSGVVSRKWSRHPITFLRRRQIDKQRLSEFGQVISQLLKPGVLKITPVISFGSALAESDLLGPSGKGNLLGAVIESEKNLLVDHCLIFGGDPGL